MTSRAATTREPLVPVYGGGPLDGADVSRGSPRLQVRGDGRVWDYRLQQEDDGSAFYLLEGNRAA